MMYTCYYLNYWDQEKWKLERFDDENEARLAFNKCCATNKWLINSTF